MSYETPTAAERAFYDAFVKRDLDAMRQVWSDAPTVACVHPGGGLLLGPDAIMQSWAEIFEGAIAPRIQVKALHVRADVEVAWHLVEEHIRSSDQARAATVISTNVYQRDAGGWRMHLHHASLPLVETQPEPETRHRPLH
jgi:hypothetical protein